MGNRHSNSAVNQRKKVSILPPTSATDDRSDSLSHERRNSLPGKAYAVGLTRHQALLIRRLWAHARKSGNDEPGRSVYEGMFSVNPDIRDKVFPLTRVEGDGQNLAKLATSLNSAWDSIIANLDKPDQLEQYLFDLGKSHQRRAKLHGFKPQYWTVFAEVMIKKTLYWGAKKDRLAQTQLAWTTLVFFVVDKMRLGYYAAKKEEAKRSKSVTPTMSKNLEPASRRISRSINDIDRNNDYLQIPHK